MWSRWQGTGFARGALRSPIPLSLALALAGCRAGTWLKTRDGAPFELGRMEVALFLPNGGSDIETGFARATLLLVDDDIDCDEFARDPHDLDGAVWDRSGVFADLSFSATPVEGGYGYSDYGYGGEPYDGGWDDWIGSYHTGGSIQSVDESVAWLLRRDLSLDAFADGLYYETGDSTGSLEVKDAGSEEIRGTIEHLWYRGRFVAEVCDRVETDSGYGDYGEYGYGYR